MYIRITCTDMNLLNIEFVGCWFLLSAILEMAVEPSFQNIELLTTQTQYTRHVIC